MGFRGLNCLARLALARERTPSTIKYNDIMFTNVFVSICVYEYKQGANYPVLAYILCISFELSLPSFCIYLLVFLTVFMYTVDAIGIPTLNNDRTLEPDNKSKATSLNPILHELK